MKINRMSLKNFHPINQGRIFNIHGILFHIPEDIVSAWDVGKLPTVDDIGVRIPWQYTLPRKERFEYLVVIGANGGWPLSHQARLIVRFDDKFRRLPISPINRHFALFGEMQYRGLWIQAVPIGFQFKEMEIIGLQAEPNMGILAGVLIKKLPSFEEKFVENFFKTRSFYCAGKPRPITLEKIDPGRWVAEVDVPDAEYAELEIGAVSRSSGILLIDGNLTGAVIDGTAGYQFIEPGKKHFVEVEVEGEIIKSFLVIYPRGYLKQLEEWAERRLKFMLKGVEKTPIIRLVSQSHIDVAWLWTKKETRKKIARTISRGIEIAKRFPGFPYVQSSPGMIKWIKHDYPKTYATLKDAVKNKYFEPVGAMWVEPDVNIPSGESLMRQLEYATKFWKEEFGKRITVDWLLDSFGYPWTLPMLYRKFGIKAMMTAKLTWFDTNRFPFDVFIWRSPDGSEIVVQHARLCQYGLGKCFAEFDSFCEDYIIHNPLSEKFAGKVFDDSFEFDDEAAEVPDAEPPAMILFGESDGGGGPTIEQTMVSQKAVETGRFTGGGAVEYFNTLWEKYRSRLPVWNDEIYLETHRGIFSRGRELKDLLKKCEIEAFKAEAAIVLSGDDVKEYRDELNEAWQTLLVNQFHDIACATDSQEAYEESIGELKNAFDLFKDVEKRALGHLRGGRLGVLNLLPWSRIEPAKIGGKIRYVHVPPFSIGAPEYVDPPSDFDFELGFKEWKIYSIKYRNRELLKAPIEFQLFKDEHKGAWTWNIDPEYELNPLPVEFSNLNVHKEQNRIIYRYTYRLGRNSRGVIVITNVKGRKWLEIDVTLDWHEDFAILKLAFPFNVESKGAFCGIPYGVKFRPFRPESGLQRAKWEVPVKRFADVSDGKFGISVFTFSNYGFDFKRGYPRVTLVRTAPVWPYPELDYGEIRMKFAIYPHEGDYVKGDVERTYREYIYPLREIFYRENISIFELEPSPLVTDCIRPENGGQIFVRIFNPSNNQVDMNLNFGNRTIKDKVKGYGLLEKMLANHNF